MKRWALPAGICAVGALLLARPEQTADAVRQGFALCAGSVLPALFPFFVLSSAFLACGGGAVLGRLLAPGMGRLFGLSGAGASALVLGLVGGYPLGARCVGQLVDSGQISREEAERLLGFCNNAGPAFILQVVGLGRFGSLRAGLRLWLIHAVAAVTAGVLLRAIRGTGRPLSVRFSSAKGVDGPLFSAKILVDSVLSAAMTCLQVTAMVTFSLVLLQLWVDMTGLGGPLGLGFFELTQGVLALGHGRRDFVLAAALLGWGGWCVHAQTAAVLSGCSLSLGDYFLGKLLQSLLSAVLAWLWA